MKHVPDEPFVTRSQQATAIQALATLLLVVVTLGRSAGRTAIVRPAWRGQEYIKASWTTLSRSNRDLPTAAKDPKLPREAGSPWPVYVSMTEDRERVAREVREVLPQKEFATIELRTLPSDLKSVREHGLLYLPHPYVVPGGRFNEMYGWDSYFIQVGLLRTANCGLPATWSTTSSTKYSTTARS